MNRALLTPEGVMSSTSAAAAKLPPLTTAAITLMHVEHAFVERHTGL
jgi:hypothetical protein